MEKVGRLGRGIVVAGLLVAGQAVLVADPAFAAAGVSVSGNRITYTGNYLTTVSLTITLSNGVYKFVDTVGNLSAGNGCSLLSTTEVWCTTTGITLFEVTSGIGADSVWNRTSVRMNVNTGTGDDVITAGIGGGDVTPGPGNDIVTGSTGSDKIIDALDTARDQDLYFGSNGTDIVSYADSALQVAVTKDNGWNDGAAGENDNVYADVEWVYGSQGADTLNGGSGADYFQGLGGNDILTGSSGDDFLFGNSGRDTLRGNAGNDTLSDVDGETDTLNGGDDRDTCTGDTIDDRVFCEA